MASTVIGSVRVVTGKTTGGVGDRRQAKPKVGQVNTSHFISRTSRRAEEIGVTVHCFSKYVKGSHD